MAKIVKVLCITNFPFVLQLVCRLYITNWLDKQSSDCQLIIGNDRQSWQKAKMTIPTEMVVYSQSQAMRGLKRQSDNLPDSIKVLAGF